MLCSLGKIAKELLKTHASSSNLEHSHRDIYISTLKQCINRVYMLSPREVA